MKRSSTLQKVFASLACVSAPFSALCESFSLFAPSHPTTGKASSLLSVTTIQNCLVTSSRALDGEQRLDFFTLTTSGASHVDSIAYGNLLEDQNKLIPDANLRAPRDLGVQNGAVVWWSYYKVHSTTLDRTCKPTKVSSFDFTNSLNPVFDRGAAAAHVSSRRTVLTEKEVVDLITGGLSNDEVAERRYKTGLYDFTNPADPFLAGLGPQLGILGNGSLERNILTVSGNSTITSLKDKENLLITKYSPSPRIPHLNSFFGPRIPQLFNASNLNRTLADLKGEVLGTTFKGKLLDEILFPYVFEVTGVNANADLVTALGKISAPNVKVQKILGTLRLTDRSTVQATVNAIVADLTKNVDLSVASRRIEAEFSARLSETLYNSPRVPLAQVRDALQISMRNELSAQGLEGYLVNTVLAPLVDDLPILKTKFGALLDGISQNAVGNSIDVALSALDFALPDEVFLGLFLSGPSCLNIPDSSRQFIDLALVKSGPKVDPDGYALFELLKLADYYFENDDFVRLRAELSDRVNALHLNMANELASEVSRGLNFYGDLDQSISALVASRLNFKFELQFSLQQHLSERILLHLESRGIKRTAKIRPILLKAARVKGGSRDRRSSQATESEKSLLRKLTFGKLSKYLTPRSSSATVGDLLLGSLSADLISTSTIETRLDEILDDLFGKLPHTTTLGEATSAFLRNRVDPNIFGTFVSETLGEALATMSANNGGIPIALRKAWRATHGDCLAQWQVAFDSAAAASAKVQLPAIAAEFVAAEALLGSALDQSIKFVTQQTLSNFLDGVFSQSEGSYPRWHVALQSKEYTFSASKLSGVSTRLLDVSAFKEKLLLVQRNNGRTLPDLSADPNVTATLFGLDGAKEVVSLGAWNTFSLSGGADGLYVVHGDRTTTSTALLDIRKGNIRQVDLSATVPIQFARPDRVHALPENRMLLENEVAGIFVVDVPS